MFLVFPHPTSEDLKEAHQTLLSTAHPHHQQSSEVGQAEQVAGVSQTTGFWLMRGSEPGFPLQEDGRPLPIVLACLSFSSTQIAPGGGGDPEAAEPWGGELASHGGSVVIPLSSAMPPRIQWAEETCMNSWTLQGGGSPFPIGFVYHPPHRYHLMPTGWWKRPVETVNPVGRGKSFPHGVWLPPLLLHCLPFTE